MTKELVTIEFRYYDSPKCDGLSGYTERNIIIGIFDNIDEAIIAGNKAIDELAINFEVRPDDKFVKNYLYGRPKRVVTNCCYPTNDIQYFVEISPLIFKDVREMVNEAFLASYRYKSYKETQE